MKRSSKESEARLSAIVEGQGGFSRRNRLKRLGLIAPTMRTMCVQATGIENTPLGSVSVPEHADLVLWSLWSRNREGLVQGVYSHQTALRSMESAESFRRWLENRRERDAEEPVVDVASRDFEESQYKCVLSMSCAYFHLLSPERDRGQSQARLTLQGTNLRNRDWP